MVRSSTPLRMLVGLTLPLWIATTATAQEVAGTPEVQTIAEGLARPCNLALRLGGSRSGPNLMVAEGDTGRVLGLSTRNLDGGLVEVIEPAAESDKWGDAHLVFRSRNRVLMAQAAKDGSAIRVVEFDIDDDSLPMSRDEQSLRFEYQPDSGTAELTGLTRESDLLVLSTGKHQWLLKAKIRSGPPAELEPFIRTQDVTEIGSPRTVTFSHKGYLVDVEQGEETADGATLVFYHPVNIAEEPLLQLPIELSGVVSLAYSPETGNLYAASRAADSSQSGVYRLDAHYDASSGDQSCQAVRVVEVEDPTALVFDNSGALFIATAGAEGESNGKLLRVAPGL